ncbi:MAG TPA: hypothetical protein VMY42_01435, partial [Thermoguttaceae bacterium]|nr:hypothetical protein [Thermoguttaceae bacterium]
LVTKQRTFGRVSSVSREGIEVEKLFEASFRLALLLAARTTRRSRVDGTMHLLMIIFRWLMEFLPGGFRTVGMELAYASVRAVRHPGRRGIGRPDFPNVGWMKVRPVLEDLGGPVHWTTAAIPATCYRDGAERFCSIQSEGVSSGAIRAPSDTTEPSRPGQPARG